MTGLTTTDGLFFGKAGLNRTRVEGLVEDSMTGADDGELFLEYRQSESLTFDDGQLKNASYDTLQGFGLRTVAGDATGYAHASSLDEGAIKRASKTVQAVSAGHSGTISEAPIGTNQSLYVDDNPLTAMDFDAKVKLLQDIDAYTRDTDDRVRQVSVNLSGEWQAVQIIRAGGYRAGDVRPLVRINVSVVLEQDGKMETGGYGTGGRASYDAYVGADSWQYAVGEALRQASVNLEAIPAPAGEVPVVLGAGWPGILLHEAIGHGLEGDFNRKETSAFAGLMGKRIASPGVTVIDDGTMNDRRGSLSIDDEGTPTQSTTLIEDGILTGYLHDRMNARLMGTKSTGNGRRQSYAHSPIPRMTNTIMLGGEENPDDIIASVDKGIYAVSFGGGQVDITSGKFVFSCTEAYELEGGKIGRPLKGATLIGNGPDVLTKVSRIGNNMELDPGIGTCGKDGQGVPVGVGQPTMLIDELTVGGTAV
ncbi:MAG: metalloprotease TldD [Rhodospirillales bacterium]|jgi:TldD protein|nr:metalloprotease TldD [Rhodospirillales bacterium]MBT4040034.1 metalloprotease TldD [Rhodospirillales bacterium]MBT4627867.1 metalloprotease TldD [Rhodospirillales bacterium]MBT5351407.1 metalloprotease TldD [Rhodospirillales bacterium]MBT5522004.1 metalloprotease TldD [Rhodospirillales bacterium]